MNSEISDSTALSPRGILVKWANQQQSWARYIVREVLATSGPVDRETIDEAFAIFLAEERLSDDPEFTSVPMLTEASHHNAGDEPIRLLQLSNVGGVNALAPDQSIAFGRGLTVLFGQNGAGKTGYARVIKRAAGSRKHESILGNIASVGATTLPSAEFEVEIGESQHSIAWTNEVGIEHIERIAVFDSATAAVHVDEDLNYVFTPAELARFDDVTKALQEVQERITRRAEKHSSASHLSPNPLTPGSAVHRSVEDITGSTSMDAIRQMARVAPDAEETLQRKMAEAAALAAGTEGAQARELQRQVGEVTEAIDILAALTAFDPEGYNAAVTSVRDGREALTLLRSALSASTPAGLPINEHWESFVRAGADYASHSGMDDYPTDDSTCLYCGQPLGDEAHRLIRHYGDFLNSAAQQQLNAAERALNQTLPEIDEGRLERSLDTPTAFLEPPGPLVQAEKVRRDAQGSLVQIANRQPCSDAEVFGRANQLVGPLRQLRESVKQEEKKLVEQQSSRSEILPKLQQEILDLSDSIMLSSHLEDIEQCVRNAKAADTLNTSYERISSQTRRSLTLAAKRASEDAINHNFEEFFKQECAALDARPVSLDFQARRGKAQRVKRMGDHLPSEVLSEGEQKMLALADFLAECRTAGRSYPLLFDDPVSSLDERGIEGVAKRLCTLSEERQVIVFTHNIMFAAGLIEEHRGKLPKTTCIEVRDQGTDLKGFIGPDVEPRLDTPENLAKKTNNAIQEAQTETDFEREDRLISEAYSLMRSWCEAFVEQRLFQSVTQRFRAHVMMTRLEDVRVDRLADAFAIIAPMFAKISRYVTAHSQAFQQQNTKPTIGQLQDDWKDLTDARDRYAA